MDHLRGDAIHQQRLSGDLSSLVLKGVLVLLFFTRSTPQNMPTSIRALSAKAEHRRER
jgi:hypothetical protein